MIVMASNLKYAPIPDSARPRLLVDGRSARSRIHADAIRMLRDEVGFTERELADALAIDPKDAHTILRIGGKATARELADALAYWPRRAA